MKYYTGRRSEDRSCVVHVVENGDSRLLPLRLDLDNHSPTGFEWGYGGSGPAQLALAILADALADDTAAQRLHQDYKWRVIAQLERDKPWSITVAGVLAVVSELTEKKLSQ